MCVSTGERQRNTGSIHSPGRNGIEQRLWHSNELRVTNRMYRIPARGARDDIKLPNGVSLTIFSRDSDRAALFLSDSTKTSVDDNVETVAIVLRSPQHLSCIDLDPIECAIDVEDCIKVTYEIDEAEISVYAYRWAKEGRSTAWPE